MDKVINLGIPHADEHIFESIDTPGLIKSLEFSQTWKFLAGNILTKWWKGKMLEACKSGETKVVRLLMERCNSEESGLNIKDKYGRTPFLWACYNGHKDVVKLLLDHSEGIDLNTKDRWRKTAFMEACRNGHKDVVKLLLEYSKVVNTNIPENLRIPNKEIENLIKTHSMKVQK